MKNMPIAEFVERYQRGDFNSPHINVQCEAGWFDWFCKNKSLARRLKPMANFLVRIQDSPKIDKYKHYAFFKNNCPLAYELFDSLSICDMETGEVIYWVGFNVPYPDHKGTTTIEHINETRDIERVFDGGRHDAVKWFNEAS